MVASKQDIEIILPSNRIKKTHQKELHDQRIQTQEGYSLLETEDNNKLEPYLPENTKYYLNTVIRELTPLLTQEQVIEVVQILCRVFDSVECTKTRKKGDPKKHNEFLVNEFIKTKTSEACSHKTILYYRSTVKKFLKYVDKHADDVTTEEIEAWFTENMTKEHHPWTPTTQDNNRRILHSFYEWAVSRRYILFNPVKAIKPTKNKKYRVKKPFTNQDIIKLRDNAKTIRDRAIIEFLLSSGVRVAELVGLDKDNINWSERECTVIGKGNKQRYVYFDETTGYYMQKYIDGRTDDNKALWVTSNSPYERLGITGVETMIRTTGQRAGVSGRAHPHRFRHTFATRALNKGIPLEQVQQLLGHEQLDTTLIYAKVAREDVKYNHKKLMN